MKRLWALLAATYFFAATPSQASECSGTAAHGGTVRLHLANVTHEDAAWEDRCADLIDYLQLPAPPWDNALAARSQKALNDLEYFQAAFCNADADSLTCSLQPTLLVMDTPLEGSLPITMLRSEVRRHISLRPGAVLAKPLEDAQRQADRLRAFFVSEGYLSARTHVAITPVPGAIPNQGARVDVHFDMGEPWYVDKVIVAGNGSVEPRDATIAAVFRHSLLFYLGQSHFRPADLEDDTNKAITLLKEHGWPGAQVRTTYSQDPNHRTVNLLVQVERGPRLLMTVSGNHAKSVDDLRELATFKRNNAADAVEVDSTQQAMVQSYQDDGYDNVQITSSIQTFGDQLLDVHFAIDEGPKRHVTAVRLQGNEHIAEASLRDAVDLLTVPSGVFKRVYRDTYSKHDTAALQRYYRTHGFANARVHAERHDGADDGLEVTFVIDEGGELRVASIQIDDYPAEADLEAVQKQLQLHPNGPYVAASLDTDRDMLQLTLASRGYLDASVESVAVETPSGMQVVHTVHAKNRHRRGGVLMRGNVDTAAAVIEDELRVDRGEPLDLATLGGARRRLRGLDVFNDVTLKPLVVDPNSANTWLMVAVQERDTRLLDLVASFSSDDLFAIGADFRNRNLFGRAMALDLQVRLADASDLLPVRIGNVDRLSATLRAPHPLGLPFDAEYSALYLYESYMLFLYHRAGGSAGLSRPLLTRTDCSWCPNITAKLGYELTETYYEQHVDLGGLRPALAPVGYTDPTATFGRLVPTLQIDRRNTPLDPHSGYSIDLRAEAALPFMAGPWYRQAQSFWRFIVGAQGYLDVATPIIYRFGEDNVLGGPVVLALSLQYNAAGPLLGSRVPDSESYSYGGDYSVRGLANGASSAVALANYMVVASAEVRWYVYQVGIGTLQVAGFVDMGSISRGLHAVLDDPTFTAGPALRYVTPVGPLSIAYGWPLHLASGLENQPTVAPPHGRLHFTLGYTF